MRQQQRKRRHAQEGHPDHGLAPYAVAHRAAREGARRHGRQEGEQVQLRLLHGQGKALDQIEGEVVGKGRDVDELGEHQHADHGHRADDLRAVQRRQRMLAGRHHLGRRMVQAPVRDAQQHPDGQQRHQHEPGDRMLAKRNDDGRHHQRADGRARVAAHLEGRLRRAEAPARGQPRHARGLGVEGGRAHADQRRGGQQHGVAGGQGQQAHAHQRHHHAQRQQVGLGMLVGVQADPGLQQRGRDLVDQGDPADLREAQRELRLEHGIDGRQHGLDQVVEQVGKGGGADDAQQKALRGMAGCWMGGRRMGVRCRPGQLARGAKSGGVACHGGKGPAGRNGQGPALTKVNGPWDRR